MSNRYEYSEERVLDDRLDIIMKILRREDNDYTAFSTCQINVVSRDMDENRKGSFDQPVIMYAVNLEFYDYEVYTTFLKMYKHALIDKKLEVTKNG